MRDRTYRADTFILATGGLYGGGITSDYTGTLREAVFGLPLQTPAGSQDDWFAPHFPRSGRTPDPLRWGTRKRADAVGGHVRPRHPGECPYRRTLAGYDPLVGGFDRRRMVGNCVSGGTHHGEPKLSILLLWLAICHGGSGSGHVLWGALSGKKAIAGTSSVGDADWCRIGSRRFSAVGNSVRSIRVVFKLDPATLPRSPQRNVIVGIWAPRQTAFPTDNHEGLRSISCPLTIPVIRRIW